MLLLFKLNKIIINSNELFIEIPATTVATWLSQNIVSMSQLQHALKLAFPLQTLVYTHVQQFALNHAVLLVGPSTKSSSNGYSVLGVLSNVFFGLQVDGPITRGAYEQQFTVYCKFIFDMVKKFSIPSVNNNK